MGVLDVSKYCGERRDADRGIIDERDSNKWLIR